MKQAIALLLMLFSAATFAQSPLLVIVGGYHSCAYDDNTDQYSPMAGSPGRVIGGLATRLTNAGIQPRILAGCFGYDPTAWIEIGGAVSFCYADLGTQLSGPGSCMYFEEDFARPMERAFDGGVAPEPIDRFYHEMDRLAAGAANQVYFIGHSYGGWTGMRRQLISNPVPFRILVTLDPISPLRCNVSEYVSAGVSMAEGCRQAPQDINAARGDFIRGTVGRWQNFYQTQFHRLHSSAIPAAENKRIYMQAESNIFNNYHTRLNDEPRVLDEIAASIISDLGQ